MLKRAIAVVAACLSTCVLITSSYAEGQGDPPRCNDDQVAVQVDGRWVCRARNVNDGTTVRQIIQQGRSRPMQGGQKPYTGTGPQGTSELRVQPQGGFREGAFDTPQQPFGGGAPQNSPVVPQGGFGFQSPSMTASMSKSSYRTDERPVLTWSSTYSVDVTLDQCSYSAHNATAIGAAGTRELALGAAPGQYSCRVAARNYVDVVDAVLVSWSVVAVCPPSSRPADTQTGTCPPGFDGSITYQRSVTCNTSTGSWTTGDWQEIANTCRQVSCPGNPPGPDIQTSPCPAGQDGSRTLTRSYTCGGAANNWQYVAGGWVETGNTCRVNSCTVNGQQNWGGGCSAFFAATIPNGQTAALDNQAAGFTGRRVLQCVNAQISVVSDTCTPVISNCSTSLASWSQNNITCSGQLPATNHGLTASVVSTAAATTGSASYLCTNGSWSLNAGSTCAGNCPPGFTFDPVSLQCKNDPPDVCLNIPGIQIDIPLGYTSTTGDARIPGYCCPTGQTWNGTMCVAPATDVCPNIPGIQDFVPGAIEVFGMRPTTDGWLFGAVGGVTLCGSATWISNPPMPSDLPGFEYLGPTGFPVLVPYRERIVSMEIVGPWTVSPLNGTIYLVTWPVRITFSNGMSTTEPGSVSRILPEGGTGGGG